ncbi:MAG: sigma-70 family RNA polymerase sigma factor [Gemmataceae bacterium]|nr:sigma-70 family RNA polymerase sigma factor [Gemmataceae bacterium]
MANRQAVALCHLRSLVAAQSIGQTSDRQLLRRFVLHQEEAAFATLVRRYSSMVLRVCRRVLNDWHASEDAFQATFLILARRAGSIRKQQSVSSWLHGVAYRVALKARARAARQDRALPPPRLQEHDPLADLSVRELRRLLDEELERLPEKYSAPLLLCYLEGKTRDEAAQQLGWPLGTFNSRLDRGRDLLRGRLVRRGLALSSALWATLLTEPAEAAVVSTALLHGTTRAALGFVSGELVGTASTEAIALSEGMLKTMTITQWKLVTTLMLAFGVLSTGAGLWLQSSAVAQAQGNAERPVGKSSPGEKMSPTDAHGDPLPAGALARMGTLRWRHGNAVTFVGFAPDGKTLASASRDGTVRVWDIETGKEIRRFGKVQGAAEPKGDDELAMLFMAGNDSNAVGAAFSPDGSVLASSSGGNVIHLWDPATGKELRQIKAPNNRVASLTFSADSKMLASRGQDRVLHLWDVATAKEIRQFKAKVNNDNLFFLGGQAGAVAIAPDGKSIASADIELDNMNLAASIKFWEVSSGKELRTIKVPDTGVSFLTFTPDGKTIAYSSGNAVHLADAATGKEVRKLEGHAAAVQSIVFSADGKILLSKSTRDQEVRIWDVESGKGLRHFGAMPNNRVGLQALLFGMGGNPLAEMALSRDGKTVAVGGENSTIRRWDVETGKELPQVGGHAAAISALMLSPDGKWLITQSSDGTLRRWDAVTGKESALVRLPEGTICAAFAPDGKTVALGNSGRTIRLHDLAADKEIRSFEAHAEGTAILAFSADGKVLATRGRGDNTIRLFDVASGKEVKQIGVPVDQNNGNVIQLGGRTPPVGLCFSPDGRLLASPGPKNALHIWDVGTGKEVRQLKGNAGDMASFTFSPDSRSVATENADQTVSVWEVLTAHERCRLGKPPEVAQPRGMGMMSVVVAGFPGSGVQGASTAVAFSPDGRVLAARSSDASVRLWEIATGKEIGSFKGHQGHIGSLAFAADGRTLATGSSDTTALLWDVARLTNDLKPANAELSDGEIEKLWGDLSGEASDKAFRGIHTLARAPKSTVPFLRGKLKPVDAVDSKRIEQLIGELADKQFAVRQKAAEELEKMGELAELALKKTLEGQPGLEVGQRIEKLLEKLVTAKAPHPDRLRVLRALETLETIGTPEAYEVLESIAKGAPEARPTQDAKAALERRARR